MKMLPSAHIVSEVYRDEADDSIRSSALLLLRRFGLLLCLLLVPLPHAFHALLAHICILGIEVVQICSLDDGR